MIYDYFGKRPNVAKQVGTPGTPLSGAAYAHRISVPPLWLDEGNGGDINRGERPAAHGDFGLDAGEGGPAVPQ